MSMLNELENQMSEQTLNEESWSTKRERKAEEKLDAILNAVNDPKVKEALFALKSWSEDRTMSSFSASLGGGPSYNNMDGRTAPSNKH